MSKRTIYYWRKKAKLWFILHNKKPKIDLGVNEECPLCPYYNGVVNSNERRCCKFGGGFRRLVLERNVVKYLPNDWVDYIFYGAVYIWTGPRYNRGYRYCVEWVKHV